MWKRTGSPGLRIGTEVALSKKQVEVIVHGAKSDLWIRANLDTV